MRHADGDLKQRQPQQTRRAAAPRSPRRQTAGSAVPSRIQPFAQCLLRSDSCAASAPGPGMCRSRWRSRRPRPSCQRSQVRLQIASSRRNFCSPTGSIAGARSPRGNSRPTACITASAGVLRREREQQRDAGTRGQSRHDAARCPPGGSGSANPSRRRDRTGRASGSSMSPTMNSQRRRVEIGGDALARQPTPASATDRSRPRCAPRRAASIDSAPVPQPASSRRAPLRSAGSHDSSVLRISSRPARTVARMRPTGASDVSRAQASTAVRSK